MAGLVTQYKHAILSNCPWGKLDAESVEDHFGFRKVILLNDFNATGYGILEARKSDIYKINPKVAREIGKNMCVLGAGTGLGNCYMVSQVPEDIGFVDEKDPFLIPEFE